MTHSCRKQNIIDENKLEEQRVYCSPHDGFSFYSAVFETQKNNFYELEESQSAMVEIGVGVFYVSYFTDIKIN